MKNLFVAVFALVCAASFSTAIGQALIDEAAIKDQDAFSTPPAPVLGNGVSYDGTNVGGISFDRAFATCDLVSGLGPVLADVQPFFVSATGAYDVSSVQDYDGYIHIYSPTFDPADSLINCIIGDDDGDTGIGSSDIDGVILDAGVQYVLVTSAFSAGDEGIFTNTIEGAGDVSLGLVDPLPPPPVIPALNIWGLLILAVVLGLGATLMARRMQN